MHYPQIKLRQLEQKIWQEKHQKIRTNKIRFSYIFLTEGVMNRYGLVEMALLFARADKLRYMKKL